MTQVAPPIRVPERGTADISQEQWATLDRSPEFWELVRAKIISVEHRGRDAVQLSGKAHVGRAYVNGVLLDIHEKVPGATAALMAAASPRLRQQHLDSPTSELGRLVRLLVHAFVEEVKSYAGTGRDWRYDEEYEVGSTVGGRLNLRGTIALRARGQRHLVAFHRTTVTRITATNRVILAALREIEVLSGLQPLPPDDITAARGLAVLFEDCLDAEVLTRSPLLAVQATELAETASAEREDLLALASLLLSHESLEPDAAVLGRAPRAWFVNLEALFERVVLSSLRAAAPSGVRVSKGGPDELAVFPDTGHLEADPDLVIGQPATAVGDVKYKTWDGSAAPSDLYQLLVHASTFKANEAFLIFPADHFAEVDLGASTTGCRSRLFAIDVADVPTAMSRIFEIVDGPIVAAEVAAPSVESTRSVVIDHTWPNVATVLETRAHAARRGEAERPGHPGHPDHGH